VTSLGLSPDVLSTFPGTGEMAARCRALDWSKTSLGSVEQWPESLRAAVRTAIECPFPINLWCGTELLLIYNDAYTRVLGAKHPDALGRPGSEVWREIWPTIGSWFDDIRAGGASVYQEDARFLMQRTSGPPGDARFTFSLSPVRDDTGDIVAFYNVATETTSRIQAEHAAEEARAAAERAERYLREVFAQAPAFLAVLRGENHVFEFVNDAYLRLIGNRDVVGKPAVEALPEVVGQGFVELLDRVLEYGEPFVGRETPIMLQRRPGAQPEEAFLDFIYQPLTDANGTRIGIVAHGSDVTDSVRARDEIERLWRESDNARAAAQESEARYRFLAEAIPVQVWTARPDGSLDYVSDRTAAYFAKTAAEVVGEQWVSVLHPDDVGAALERWRASVESGQPYEAEFRLWSAEHRAHRWYLARAAAQRDADGRIVRWFGTNTDVEDSKRAEQELIRLTREATEANHAKSAFLAAMSHELRTPLNAIGGYAQLIEMGVRGPINEEQRVDLLKIQRSKNHLDALVSDVLNFAKLGSGRIEYRIGPVDVQRVVHGVLEMVMPQLSEKKLHLAPFSTPRGLTVTADEDKLRQILLNLLANALKFTPAGGTVSLGIRSRDSDVSIEVCDTGIGIAPDQLERIFEPFVQAKRALNLADQGVGLGLAISRQLARAMGGDLNVKSGVGRGSVFTVTLPRFAK
jgi:PAS domain S-box-containing protein